jgi:hypothetical protein
VALVIGCLAFAGGTEWLAGTGASPNRSAIGPSGESESDGPSADASEKVALGITSQIVWPHVGDASLVDFAWGDEPCADEIAEPLGGIGIDLVVIGGHAGSFKPSRLFHQFEILKPPGK